jgi:two-component system, cell cycle sensor histidine kinase and response regulator CckA
LRELRVVAGVDARVPIGLVSLAFALTVLSLAWFGWLTHALSHDAKAATDASIRIERLRGDVLHLGEALGSTVRLAATTGETTWEERYRRFEPRIEVALEEVKSLAGDLAMARDFVPLDESNARLVEMENRALALVREGDLSAARTLVFSDEYAALELVFVESIESITETARQNRADEAVARRRASLPSLVGSLLAVACAFAAWLFAVRSLRRWKVDRETAIRDRLEAATSLRDLNEALETRVRQRTVELQSVNHSLREEADERRRVENALRARTELFDQLADNITDVFWIRSPDSKQLRYVSPAFERIWGRSVASLYADPSAWTSFILEDDRERVTSEFAGLTAGTPNVDISYRIVRPDGEIRWVQLRAFQVRESSGELISLTGIVTDITEQQRVTSRLRESEERFRSYFELGLVGMAITSPTRGMLEVNDELCRILGYEREELLQKNWTELTHPDDLAADLEQFDRVMAGEIDGYSLDKRFIRKDGETVDTRISANCLRRADGSVDYLVSMAEDITARKRAEATRDRLAAIVESSTDFVGFTDPSGRVLYINRAGRELLELDPGEDITRMAISDCIPDPETHPTLTEGLPTAIRDGAWSGEVRLLQRSGQEVITSQVILAHKGADGELEYLSTIIRDLTDRKRLEATLLQTQKMETIGRLAAGVAHEFNSLLTAIAGQSELVRAGLPAGSPLVKNATKIGEAATRAGVLTRKLLAYGRKQTMNPRRHDLNQIIESMEPTFRLILGESVTIRRDLDPRLYATRVDADQLEQVLVNLATNAADAMTGGGTFTLETANVAIDDKSADLHPQVPLGGYAMVTITDTGVGMSPAVKARLFEPFFTTKAVGQGTGLGLATCHGIIEQSGGHIAVESVPDHGTTFRIYLPRDVEPIDERPRPSGLPSGTETILFVEGDRGLREMATGLLSRLGYSILAAATEDEALALIGSRGTEAIDLLLTEAAAPGPSGNDMVSRMQAAHPASRTLFTSAAERGDDHPSIADATFLRKPFTPSALAQQVREVLDRP